MKKIIIIGCPGSGKSTLARRLARLTKLSLYHLDMMNWQVDKTTVATEIFIERQRKVP
uniref:AAA family ATPase n=1 Tax=Streptococcus pluranimalium TaxID=82348 RepID=UPI003F694088